MKSLMRNPASELFPIPAIGTQGATAGAGNDGVQQNGYAIDTQALPRCEAIAFVYAGRAVMAAGGSITVTGRIQTSNDGTNWVDIPEQAKNDVKTVTVPAKAAGGAVDVVLAWDTPLEYCGRYVRCQVTQDLSASGTDTYTGAVIGLLSGVLRQTAI